MASCSDDDDVAPAAAAAAAAAAAGTAAPEPVKYRAACVRSGNVVVLAMQPKAVVNCAGMALFRVFQGNVEVLGFRPPLGVYYSLSSPKWSNLIVIEGKLQASSSSSSSSSAARVCQATFGQASSSLLQATEPTLLHEAHNLDEEQAADELATKLAADFPIVLVFRSVPLSYGNVTGFYENTRAEKPAAVLPGFKMIVARYNQRDLRDAIDQCDVTSAPPAGTDPSSHDWKSPERVLSELAVVDSFKILQLTEHWEAAVDRLEKSLLAVPVEDKGRRPPQRIVVCGAKGVGKSTFCRYAVNRLLAHFGTVAFLDTDLGQSELTPPGLVSLHALTTPLLGPGFAHMRTPLRSFFCGGTNPGNDPLYYMQAVKSLLRMYESKWGVKAQSDSASLPNKASAVVPLVINTDGWIKSMGHDLLCSVIQEAEPDHVVQMLAATKNKQFDVPTDGKWEIHGVRPWDPVGLTQPPRSSKEMRLYRFHSYFLSSSKCSLTRPQLQNLHVLSEKNRVDGDIYRAYTELTPFAVSFDQVDVSFADSSVPPSQLLYSLNACVVGLCVNVDHRVVKRSEAEANQTNLGPPRVVLQPVHAPCVGVGIVRAVDADQRLLYILSPLPLSVLKRVNLLVRSNIPLGSILLAASEPVQAPYIVTDVVASDGTGSGAMQSRNNLKRKRDGK